MTVPRAEKAYEKYAWIFLLAVGIEYMTLGLALWVGSVLNSSYLYTAAPSSYPKAAVSDITEYAAEDGVLAVLIGLITIGVVWKSYRRYQRWSWYVVLVLFLSVLLDDISSGQTIAGPFFGTLTVILSLIGLLLPARKFLPRKQP